MTRLQRIVVALVIAMCFVTDPILYHMIQEGTINGVQAIAICIPLAIVLVGILAKFGILKD